MKLFLSLIFLPLLAADEVPSEYKNEDFCTFLGLLSRNPTAQDVEKIILPKLSTEDLVYIAPKITMSKFTTFSTDVRPRLERLCQTSPSVLQTRQHEVDLSFHTIKNNLQDLKSQALLDVNQDVIEVISKLNLSHPVPETVTKTKLIDMEKSLSQIPNKNGTAQELVKSTIVALEKIIMLVWSPVRLINELEDMAFATKSVFSIEDHQLKTFPKTELETFNTSIHSLLNDFQQNNNLFVDKAAGLVTINNAITGLKDKLQEKFGDKNKRINLALAHLTAMKTIVTSLEAYMRRPDLQSNIKYAARQFRKIASDINTLKVENSSFSTETYKDLLDVVFKASAPGEEFSYDLYQKWKDETDKLENKLKSASGTLRTSGTAFVNLVKSILGLVKDSSATKEIINNKICVSYNTLKHILMSKNHLTSASNLAMPLLKASVLCEDKTEKDISTETDMIKFVNDLKIYVNAAPVKTDLQPELEKLEALLKKD